MHQRDMRAYGRASRTRVLTLQTHHMNTGCPRVQTCGGHVKIKHTRVLYYVDHVEGRWAGNFKGTNSGMYTASWLGSTRECTPGYK